MQGKEEKRKGTGLKVAMWREGYFRKGGEGRQNGERVQTCQRTPDTQKGNEREAHGPVNGDTEKGKGADTVCLRAGQNQWAG